MGRKKRSGTGRKCPDCGTLHELEARYCSYCGNTFIKGSSREKGGSRGREPSYWKVLGFIVLIFSVGLAIKVIFSSAPDTQDRGQGYNMPVSIDDSLEREVRLVASHFRCACGGCGELPLISCECDMPRGAMEEKKFIREKLKEGFSVDQVIQLVDGKYGFRRAG
jgi:hypothetical protein